PSPSSSGDPSRASGTTWSPTPSSSPPWWRRRAHESPSRKQIPMSIPTIQLDTPGSGGIPAAKFNDVGSSVVVGIVNIEDSQRYDRHAGKPMFWDDGNPQMYKRVTGLVVTSNGAVTGKQGEERPLEEGELVTFHCHGGRHFT